MGMEIVIIIILVSRMCTLWRCKSVLTQRAKLLWMTSHYGLLYRVSRR